VRSPDNRTYEVVKGAPGSLSDLYVVGGVLYATSREKLWRSEDGLAWKNVATLGGASRGRLDGDARLVVHLRGTGDRSVACSTDRGLTFHAGRDLPDDVSGLAVLDGELWISSGDGKKTKLERSPDCKTFADAGRPRMISGLAAGVFVTTTDTETEVSFDERKTWKKSPASAANLADSVFQLATSRGLLDVWGKGTSWFVAKDGARKVPMDEVLIDRNNVDAFERDGFVYVAGNIEYTVVVYRASLDAILKLPKSKK
jgi:hypothetical protein